MLLKGVVCGALTRKRTREQRKNGCARTRLMSMKAMAFCKSCLRLTLL